MRKMLDHYDVITPFSMLLLIQSFVESTILNFCSLEMGEQDDKKCELTNIFTQYTF
jgi:hypothetical protein